MCKPTLLALFVVLISLGFSQANAAPVYTMLRLTDNEFRDTEPRINDSNDVVWHGADGNDYEIFLYEWLYDQVWQITDNSFDDLYPKVNNNGDIAWRQDGDTNMRILFYDRSEDTIREIVNRDNDNSWNTLVPFMNNNGDIVWHENTGYAYNIFFYDGSTEGTYQLTSDTMMDNYNPKINDRGEITWFRYYTDLLLTHSDYHFIVYCDTNLSSIGYYDTNLSSVENIWSLKTEVGILETNVERHEPLISNCGNVIWSFYDQGLSDTEIYYYDRQAGVVLQLTDNFEYDVIPDINSYGDAVWREQFDEGMGADIVLYTHSTGERLNVSDSEHQPYTGPTMCRISDNGYVTYQAVEQRMTSWDNEVYVWDGSEIINVSNTPDHEYYPRINCLGNVVWTVDTDGEDDEIYIACLPEDDGEENGDEDDGLPDCFIATACYDSAMAEEVQILRDFRDKYLIESPVGRTLVRFYNAYGPGAADFIRDKELLKILIRQFLKPVIRLIEVVS